VGVLAVLGLLWTALVLAVGAVALTGDGTLGAALAMVVPSTVAAVVRTVGRPPPRYDDLGTVDAGLGQVPVRLVLGSVRGPDVAVLGTLFAAAGFGSFPSSSRWWCGSTALSGCPQAVDRAVHSLCIDGSNVS
jgi:hypothetical protein